jgi:formylglycine-generating enzyme required for sulfatase activity
MTTKRVLHGGSWFNGFARVERCAFRSALGPGFRHANLGLRPVAKAIPPDSPRILRGGSLLSDARLARCAFRNTSSPGIHYVFLGLRPVAKAKP